MGPLESVPDDDILGQLDRVKADGKCPSCGHNAWCLSPATFALVPIENGRIMIDRAGAVRALTCDSCGFVRLHDINRLMTD